MNNRNIQKKIKSLLKEYGELFVVQPVGDTGFELTMPIDEVVSAIGVKRR